MGKGGSSGRAYLGAGLGLVWGFTLGCIAFGGYLFVMGITRLVPGPTPTGDFIEHDGGCVITASTLVESGRSSVRAGGNECIDLYVFDVKFVGSIPSDLNMGPFESREWTAGVRDSEHSCGSPAVEPTPLPVPAEYSDGKSHQCWYPNDKLTHQETISYKCSTNYFENRECYKLFNPAEDYSPPSTGWLLYMLGGGFCLCCGCPFLFILNGGKIET